MVASANIDRYDLYYRVVYTRLQDQDRRNSELESKASTIIGVAVTLGGIGGAIFAIMGSSLKDGEAIPTSMLAPLAGALAFLCAAVFCGVTALFPRDWRRDPKLSALAGHVCNPQTPTNQVTYWVCDQMQKAIDANESIIGQKSSRIKCGYGFLTGQALAVGLTSVFPLWF